MSIAQGADDDPAVDVRRGVAGIQGEHLGERIGGVGRPAQRLPRQAEAGMISRHVRADRHGPLDPVDGLVDVTLLMKDDPQQATGIGVVRIPARTAS